MANEAAVFGQSAILIAFDRKGFALLAEPNVRIVELAVINQSGDVRHP